MSNNIFLFYLTPFRFSCLWQNPMSIPFLACYLWILWSLKLMSLCLAFLLISVPVIAIADGRSVPLKLNQIQFSFAPVVEKVAPGVVKQDTDSKTALVNVI